MKGQAVIPARNLRFSLTVELQFESRDLLETSEDNLTGRFSYGVYGAKLGIWRILAMLERLGIPGTFFIAASDAARHPEIVDAVLERGHEVAAHGWAHERPAGCRESEEASIRQAHETLEKLTGRPPVGWRSPTGLMSPHTLDILASLGYLYDSSFQDDDGPYMHQLGSRSLVELPCNEVLSDSFFYAMHVPHAAIAKAWREDFSALVLEGDGLPCFSISPRGDIGSGRTARLAIVERFLRDALLTPGVSFHQCQEIAVAVQRAAVERHVSISTTHHQLTST